MTELRKMYYGGHTWPYAGPVPAVGDVMAGFIVDRVVGSDVYLKLPKTPEEVKAADQWEWDRRYGRRAKL